LRRYRETEPRRSSQITTVTAKRDENKRLAIQLHRLADERRSFISQSNSTQSQQQSRQAELSAAATEQRVELARAEQRLEGLSGRMEQLLRDHAERDQTLLRTGKLHSLLVAAALNSACRDCCWLWVEFDWLIKLSPLVGQPVQTELQAVCFRPSLRSRCDLRLRRGSVSRYRRKAGVEILDFGQLRGRAKAGLSVVMSRSPVLRGQLLGACFRSE